MRSTTSRLGLAVSAGLALAVAAPLGASAAPQTPTPAPGPLGTLPATPLPATPLPATPAPETNATTRYVAVPLANVRSAPSMNASVVGSERLGARVSGPVSNGWLKMADGRYIGLSVTSATPPGGGGEEPPGDGRVHRTVNVSVANVRSGPSLDAPVVGQKSRGDQVSGGWTGTGWLILNGGQYIHSSVLGPSDGPAPAPPSDPDPEPPSGPVVSRVVDVPLANVRSGPGLNHSVIGTMRSGQSVEGEDLGGWIKMSNGRHISESVLRSGGGSDPAPPVTQPTQGYVSVNLANVRKGPGLNHGVVGSMTRGEEVRGSVSGGWVKMANGRYISTSVISQAPPGGEDPEPPGDGSVTGAEVLAEAAKYNGVPYVWGGDDPSGFDCSGYTRWVFKELGISLPRTAAQQRAATTPITSPRPGDLVFWGHTSHVGIYAGDGYIWDAGRPGVPVQKRKIFSGVTGYGAVDGVSN